jgi:hypothetical protein
VTAWVVVAARAAVRYSGGVPPSLVTCAAPCLKTCPDNKPAFLEPPGPEGTTPCQCQYLGTKGQKNVKIKIAACKHKASCPHVIKSYQNGYSQLKKYPFPHITMAEGPDESWVSVDMVELQKTLRDELGYKYSTNFWKPNFKNAKLHEGGTSDYWTIQLQSDTLDRVCEKLKANFPGKFASGPDGEHCSGYGANSGWHISIPIGWADTSKHTITVQEQRYLRGEDEKTGTALPDADAPIKWYVTVQYSDGCWEAQPYRLATL